MERPRGLEPPPTAWQAVVLPLYYGRSEQPIFSTPIYSMGAQRGQEGYTRAMWTLGESAKPGAHNLPAIDSPAKPAAFSEPDALVRTAQQAISSGDRRTGWPARDPCKYARTVRRRDRTRSPASGGACGADPY